MTIEVEINVKSKENSNTQTKAVSDLASKVASIQNDNSNEAQQLKKISVGGDTLILEKVESVGSVTSVCADGQIYGSYVKDIVGQNGQKVSETSCSKFLCFFIVYYKYVLWRIHYMIFYHYIRLICHLQTV